MGFLDNGSGMFYNYCYNSVHFNNRGSPFINIIMVMDNVQNLVQMLFLCTVECGTLKEEI